MAARSPGLGSRRSVGPMLSSNGHRARGLPDGTTRGTHEALLLQLDGGDPVASERRQLAARLKVRAGLHHLAGKVLAVHIASARDYHFGLLTVVVPSSRAEEALERCLLLGCQGLAEGRNVEDVLRR